MSESPSPHRLHWLSWLPTPYNDYLFLALSEDPDLDLTVHYREQLSKNHPWRTQLGQGHKARFYKPFLGIDWQVFREASRDKQAFFVIAGWEHPTSLFLIHYLALSSRRFAVWTDTPNLSRKRALLFALLRSTWLRWVFRHATKVMGTGRPGVEALREMGAPSNKLVEFPFFLNLDTYRPSISPIPADIYPMRFISSGRLQNSIKGHDLALRAFAIASRKASTAFEYLIVGTGPDEAMLRDLAQALGLHEQVRFMGWVEPAPLARLYATSQVLVHPSPAHDPFPNAVLEGMAAGLAIVGSDVSGSVRDRVEHGVNGLIHRSGDIDSLADHLEYALRNPGIVLEMGRKSREVALTWPVERGVHDIKLILGANAQGIAETCDEHLS